MVCLDPMELGLHTSGGSSYLNELGLGTPSRGVQRLSVLLCHSKPPVGEEHSTTVAEVAFRVLIPQLLYLLLCLQWSNVWAPNKWWLGNIFFLLDAEQNQVKWFKHSNYQLLLILWFIPELSFSQKMHLPLQWQKLGLRHCVPDCFCQAKETREA